MDAFTGNSSHSFTDLAISGRGMPLNLSRTYCLRNAFGGDNSNGGCHTTLSTTQGGLALGAVGVIVQTAT